MNKGESFTKEIKEFISSVKWTYAKTYHPKWPHEYIVRERVDNDMFIKMVNHIRQNGYEGKFYHKNIGYFDEDGFTYWTMGEPLEKTTIINRTQSENTYENRLKNGTLPKD